MSSNNNVHDVNSNNINAKGIPKRTRKLQRGRQNNSDAIDDRTKLHDPDNNGENGVRRVGNDNPPVDQETDNSNHLSNSAHVQNPNQGAIPPAGDDAKGALGKHYRSTMVHITPTGNVTLTLDYVAKCPIDGKDAISALSRAKTAQCKQEIADIVCQNQKMPLYPTHLPRYCPIEGEQIKCESKVTTKGTLSQHLKAFK